MNKVNFLAKENFPTSTYTFDFLQNMIKMAGSMALLGGDNFILSGCVDNGSGIVSNGLVVIDGELLHFEGGAKKDKISIQEVKETDHYAGIDYPEAYIHRKVVFDVDGSIIWNDLKQVLTNNQLQVRIEAIRGDDPGTVKMWSGRVDKISSDYRLCDGSILSINDYPELFENIGSSFGGNGVNNFALPDIRGRFIVGYDSTKSDYNAISSSKIGGLEKVTLSVNEMPEHNHVNNPLFNKLSAKAADIDEQSTPGAIDQLNPAREYNVGSMTEDRWSDATIQKVGRGQAHENRPPYFVLAYIIKVK